MKPPTKTQQRVLDALGTEQVLMYWPAGGMGNGHFQIGTKLGHYNREVMQTLCRPSVPHTTIPALEKAGLLALVSTFQADATGRKGYIYRLAERKVGP